MECTFLLGKTPASKRKKPHSEVEILEARLETIESRYTERLNQMENLLSKVMPGTSDEPGSSSSAAGQPQSSSSSSKRSAPSGITISSPMDADDGWQDMNSPQERQLPYDQWSQGTMDTVRTPTMNALSMDLVGSASGSGSGSGSGPGSGRLAFLKEEPVSEPLFTPEFQSRSLKSPASSIAPSLSNVDHIHEDNNNNNSSDDEGDLGELAATLDKLRLFDASVYFGKGSMLFTSTDQNQFWDEEISFDVHDVPHADIPVEATILPPVEVIDALFDVYYRHYYPYLPMIQKTTLLQALEDRFEPQSIFLLNAVFMAASLTGEVTHPCCFSTPNDAKTLGTPFFDRARLVLDYCIGIPRLSTVQGLIMLSRYPRISGLGHSYTQQAIMMAQDLGLHRKCDRWIKDKEIQDARIRVFWCLYAADSSTSSVTGRRPVFDDTEIDVPMVAAPSEPSDVDDGGLHTLFLIHGCKLWRIYRNIKRYIFNAVDVQEMAPGSLPKSYEQQLIQWQLQLPVALRFQFDVKADDPRALYNSRAGISQMVYESSLILLHKPYLSSSEHLKRSPYRSQDICIKAATKITEIAKVLAQTYYKAFELTSVGEYAMLNAVRIHVMFLKSADAKVAEQAQIQFDFIMRFFREFYSSPRSNCDEQSINCVLSFFEEFMHTVKGLSQSSVHVCAGAIKSLALAKQKRLALGKVSGARGGAHGAQVNMSRLVKIGKQERAKARSQSIVSPSPSLQRKRHSHMQHEAQQRLNPGQILLQQQQQQHNQLFQQQLQRQGSSSSAGGGGGGNSPSYFNPGKLQKVSQFVGPFGGPQVMESLQQFQTSTAILNQPQQGQGQGQTPLATTTSASTNTSPIATTATGILSSTGQILSSPFGQGQQNQPMTLTMQQLMQQQIQQHQQAQQQHQQVQHQQSQPQQQQLFNQMGGQQIGQQMGLFDSSTFNPTFWATDASDAGAGVGGNVNFLSDPASLMNQNTSNGGNTNSSTSAAMTTSDATTSISTSTTAATLGNNNGNNMFANGFMNSTLYNNNFNFQQQPQQLTTSNGGIDPSGLFLTAGLKKEPVDNSSQFMMTSPGLLDEELNADQVQALLEQTLAAANNNNSNNNTRNVNPSYSVQQGQGQQQQGQFNQPFQQQQFRQQQQVSLELSGIPEEFHTSNNWPGMM
ncbi:Transcriptional activator of fatty acid utilization [Gryganskiella cystojenkinii]|nr:Transcriptional activator of fatty acid utilization [Gryganskiella cystojenkinii]